MYMYSSHNILVNWSIHIILVVELFCERVFSGKYNYQAVVWALLCSDLKGDITGRWDFSALSVDDERSAIPQGAS